MSKKKINNRNVLAGAAAYPLDRLVEPALTWYESHKRILPWRESRDPYAIWVSEIMLQQTRVEAVKPYYQRFMQSLPDIAALAACPQDQLMKLWEGLGYYNRVRNMQRAAQIIMEEFDGAMPADYRQIQSLPGIGPYTAGAISSIAFGLPHPAVDGNVLRILSRVTMDSDDILKESTKKKVTQALCGVMPKGASGEFNQALMEIGATVCVPGGPPRCGDCPWEELCLTHKNGCYDSFPVKTKAKPRKIEEKTVLIILDGSKMVIRKRPEQGLLAGLYELPNLPGEKSVEEVLAVAREHGLEPLHIKRLPDAKHIFSHVEWHMKGYMIRVADVQAKQADLSDLGEYLLVELEDTRQHYAIPAAFEKYVNLVNITLGLKKEL